MKISSFNKEEGTIILSYDEVYTILQCIAHTRDSLSSEDIDTIIGTDDENVEELAESFNEIKERMRP